MKIWSLLVFGQILLACGVMESAGRERLIFPDPSQKIVIVESQGRQDSFPIGERLSEESLLVRAIMTEMDLPFHQSVIRLNQCSRNFSSGTEGPNVLFLSKNEGGFPRHGLILKEKDQLIEYPDLNYVELVLDEQRTARGDLDIYAHELGHVMMMHIWEGFPEGKSSKQHVSMGVTDYHTAFFEGWGIHFQRLVHDSIERYRETFSGSFDYSRGTGTLWHSNVDKELRLNAVLQNKYIYQKLLPNIDLSNLDKEELILLEHTSPIFDSLRLKNAQQMLSCEGVIATLFLRINSNRILQENYRDTSFYEKFLLSPMPEEIKPQDIFTPFENVILKNFWIWSRVQKEIEEDSILFIEFLKEWMSCFPEDEEEILRLFILTTVGRTVSNDLARIYEQMAYFGMIGEIQNFRDLMPDYTRKFRDIMTKISAQELFLEANIGPQLWIKNDQFLIRQALGNPQHKKPLWINLNTASEYELATLPGIDMEEAVKIVRKRQGLGYFNSQEEAGLRSEDIK